MKKFVIALIVVAMPAITFGQTPDEGSFHRHGRRAGLHQLAAELSLSDAQKQQMKEIRSAERENNKQLNADFRAKLQELKALRQANDPAAAEVRAQVESMRPQIEAAHKATHEAILGVLTADQREQLKTARQARRVGSHQAGTRGMGMGRNQARVRQAVAMKLNLTDEQKAQLHQLRQVTREKNQQLFTDAHAKRKELRSLTRANDPHASDVKAQLEALRPQLEAARQEQHTAFLNVLTAEQRTQLEQWKSQREQRLR